MLRQIRKRFAILMTLLMVGCTTRDDPLPTDELAEAKRLIIRIVAMLSKMCLHGVRRKRET